MSLKKTEANDRLNARSGCVGIDVSKWQDPDEMWSVAPPDILNFCIIKFSQHTFQDPKARRHYTGAGRHKAVMRGPYHFLDPRSSGIEQAQTLLAATAGLDFDLPFTCDLEGLSNWRTPDHAGHAAADMLEHLREVRDEPPWLYTSRRHLDRLSDAVLNRLRPYLCWIASYWKNIPRAGHVPSVPRGFRVGVHQWCSDNQLDELRVWFPHNLDTNFSVVPIWQLVTQGGTHLPRFAIDQATAIAYNERQITCVNLRERIDSRVGVDPWDSWPERLQRIAEWQSENGLAADGMVGPQTIRAMDL